ncbi:MAG: imidazolonepropionase [Bacteroidota bacterium]
MKTLLTNIASLVTVKANGAPYITGEAMRDVGEILQGAILFGETIEWVGTAEDAKHLDLADVTVIDCTGMTVMPGFVDSHTHMVFAGSRAHEFARRVAGATYAEIAAEGGGILTTMKAVRQATEDELAANAQRLLQSALRHGTTTVEIKSGYGLDTETELKMLKVGTRVQGYNQEYVSPYPRTPGAPRTPRTSYPVPHIFRTFLGAHAVPPEWKHDPEAYVDIVINEMLPRVAQEGLAEFCDVFTDAGFFNVEQSTRILKKAKELGLKLKVHADEIALIGASQMAAELGCISADHLEHSTIDEIRILRDAGVVCTLLPGTAYTLRLPYPDARMMISEGAIVALATDCNPGSSYSESMPTIMSLACMNMRMSIEESITASTINGAAALGISHLCGSLEVGKRADIVLYDTPSYKDIVYHYGVNQVRAGWIQGYGVR